MKKSICITLFVMAIAAGSAFAQKSQTFTQTKTINKDEVPIAVRQTFETEFANWTEKGYWKVEFLETRSGTKEKFTPEHYTFHSKKNGEKVQMTFSPEGKLETSRGIATENTGKK